MEATHAQKNSVGAPFVNLLALMRATLWIHQIIQGCCATKTLHGLELVVLNARGGHIFFSKRNTTFAIDFFLDCKSNAI